MSRVSSKTKDKLAGFSGFEKISLKFRVFLAWLYVWSDKE